MDTGDGSHLNRSLQHLNLKKKRTFNGFTFRRFNVEKETTPIDARLKQKCSKAVR